MHGQLEPCWKIMQPGPHFGEQGTGGVERYFKRVCKHLQPADQESNSSQQHTP